DPSMHSSQNEQDSRFYGRFAMIPILEPSSQQEAYEMAYSGFELSEKHNLPVLIRITTRLAHSRAVITGRPPIPQNKLHLPADPTQYVLLPAMARGKYRSLIEKQALIEAESAGSAYNQYRAAENKSLGIVACGITINYLNEVFEGKPVPYPVLKIGQYPIPEPYLKRLVDECDELLILEEGYPYLEDLLASPYLPHKKIRGRLDGTLPRTGELSPKQLAAAFAMDWPSGYALPEWLANRPPSLCKGCTHIEVFNELNEAIKAYGNGRVFSDIGCYTLGALAPYHAINSCVDMGASITMAKGAADAGLTPAVAVIGDSTFTHSGMTGLLDAIYENSPITVIISDNSTTAMTGGQESLATGRLDQICIGLGADPAHVFTFEPTRVNRQETIELIKHELAYEGLSVIIPRRECVQTAQRSKKEQKLQSEASVAH
ncbi:MAG: thiamine pyrophosphate-dependent enzyme, partial [Cyclobacteriaceae bacterium]|nr:thiamine pyrophosphate-dependent enzyme [Cyclobacteriaceae bacterium]